MKTDVDEMYEKFKDYDFADAKPVAETPVLSKLQAGQKSSITIQVDNEVLALLQARARLEQADYQVLIDEALRQFVQGLRVVEVD